MAGTKIGTLAELLASRARATYRYRVNFSSISYDTLPQMKEWCETNCKGMWREEHVHALYFQFDDDYDAIMFMLRWGGSHGTNL